MTISSGLELSLFKNDGYTYMSQDDCRFESKRFDETKELSDQEIQSCVARREQQEEERYAQSKKRDIVRGTSFLFVGGILLLGFKKRALG